MNALIGVLSELFAKNEVEVLAILQSYHVWSREDFLGLLNIWDCQHRS